MALLETKGDYELAANVERLADNVSMLVKAFEEQLEANQRLMYSVKELTEVIGLKNEQIQKLMRKSKKHLEYEATDNRHDLVLM